MIIPKQKIRVFISSACGDEPEKQKYNYVREALKVIIDATGFAEAYVFESEGASTISAGRHYRSALENCDVCIFIIDNKDGVPNGVQIEINDAKKYNIKSLFYFCDQSSKEETPLQKSLKGAKHAKSVTIHEFKDIIGQVRNDLINDLASIYRYYCKGKLDWSEESTQEQNKINSSIQLSTYSDNILKKDLVSNVDKCVSYFSKLILGYSTDEPKKSGKLDEAFAEFLPVLFEGATINKNMLNKMLAEIKQHQPRKYFEVTKKRYEAIEQYYLGHLEECISILKDALLLARDDSLPQWLKEDILIDLRNQEFILNESKNLFYIETYHQKELMSTQTMLHYPQLDRLTSKFQEGIISEIIKDNTRSPNTVTFGNNLQQQITSLAGVYVIAVFNGSLSHIKMIYRRLYYLCFYGATKYSDWNIKLLLLKSAIILGNQKETNGIVQRFDELLSKMNENDANDVYNFSNNLRIPYKKFCSQLDAFSIVAYFLDEESFTSIWADLYEKICEWIEDENLVVAAGEKIFLALEKIYLRISQDELINLICSCVRNNIKRFYDEIFSLIYRCINLDLASKDSTTKLLDMIIDIVKSKESGTNVRAIQSALISLRKKHRDLTEELDRVIAMEMPDFYENVYRLETTYNVNEDLPEFIESNIKEIKNDNEKQGKDGTYYGKGNRPHITIKNILKHSSVEFSENLIDQAFRASVETLLSVNQTIETKMDAIELLVYLLKSKKWLKARNDDYVWKIKTQKHKIVQAQSMLSNLNERNLNLAALLLYHCLEENVYVELINLLATIVEDGLSKRKASEAFLNYLDSGESSLENIQLEQIILQNSIGWCRSSDIITRGNAVQILFLLLRNINNKDVVSNQLINLIDTDNVYIKTAILRKIHALKEVDKVAYEYIIQKASVDTNYVVRKVVSEIHETKTGLI